MKKTSLTDELEIDDGFLAVTHEPNENVESKEDQGHQNKKVL